MKSLEAIIPDFASVTNSLYIHGSGIWYDRVFTRWEAAFPTATAPPVSIALLITLQYLYSGIFGHLVVMPL